MVGDNQEVPARSAVDFALERAFSNAIPTTTGAAPDRNSEDRGKLLDQPPHGSKATGFLNRKHGQK